VTSRPASKTAAAIAACVTAALILVTPGRALATPTIDITCVGVEHASWNPGLTLTPRPMHLTDHIDYTCLSTTAPAITSGTNDLSVDVVDSCLTVLDSGNGQRVINWNTGESSTFSFAYSYSQSGGQTIGLETGTITAGKFAGSAAQETLTGGSINILDCLSSTGVTANTTVVALIISH
jgi:hypothetical protein